MSQFVIIIMICEVDETLEHGLWLETKCYYRNATVSCQVGPVILSNASNAAECIELNIFICTVLLPVCHYYL